jgi:hypothetical protein
MIGSRHTRLHEGVMMDWLRHLDDHGRDVIPDQRAIMERFDFSDTESARTLIAQLADTGLIRITRFSGYSKFKIQPPKPPRQPSSTVNRVVEVDADDSADDFDVVDMRQIARAASKIKKAMAAKPVAPIIKQAVQIVPRIIPELPKVETFRRVEEVGFPCARPSDQGPEAKSAPVAAETVSEPIAIPLQSVEARPLKCGHPATPENIVPKAFGVERCRICKNAAARTRRAVAKAMAPPRARRFKSDMPSIPADQRRQLNMHVDADTYARVKAAAEAIDLPASTWMLKAALAALDGATAAQPKPRIPASVMRAYIADGRLFDQFMTAALELGVEAMVAFREAAE